jgi:hypothetical protein
MIPRRDEGRRLDGKTVKLRWMPDSGNAHAQSRSVLGLLKRVEIRAEFSRTASILSTRVSDEVSRGLARGVAVVGAAFVCLACFVFTGLAGMASTKPGAWKWVAGAFLAAFMAAWPLLAVIVKFNRPRFPVVPYMRQLDRVAIRVGSPSLHERLRAPARRIGRHGQRN